MNAEAIDKIIELNDQSKELVEVHGIPHAYRELHPVKKPEILTLELKSLTGLVDYINNNKDDVKRDQCVIHIESYNKVIVYGAADPIYRTRPMIVEAQVSNILQPFPFNRFLDHEDFMIKLLCLFQDSPELQDFIQRVSVIKSGDEDESHDTGIAVKTTKRHGANIATTIPGDRKAYVVKLKPFRTFIEAEQPESQFIFRLRYSEKEISCSLLECGGGAWVNNARKNLKDFLHKTLNFKEPPTIPIFA